MTIKRILSILLAAVLIFLTQAPGICSYAANEAEQTVSAGETASPSEDEETSPGFFGRIIRNLENMLKMIRIRILSKRETEKWKYSLKSLPFRLLTDKPAK